MDAEEIMAKYGVVVKKAPKVEDKDKPKKKPRINWEGKYEAEKRKVSKLTGDLRINQELLEQATKVKEANFSIPIEYRFATIKGVKQYIQTYITNVVKAELSE